MHVACVPGNHDCDFSDVSTVRNALINSVRSANVDLDYYNNVASVQCEYRSFALSYQISDHDVLPQMEIACGDSRVLFLMANTAWMSTRNEKPGKIIMPCHLYEDVLPEKYKAVFYVLHHPVNWLDPDLKMSFVDHVRQNADMVLVGHEHSRDRYETVGDSFHVYCSHGKELQDNNSNDSAFTVINFKTTMSLIMYGTGENMIVLME